VKYKKQKKKRRKEKKRKLYDKVEAGPYLSTATIIR
jgi:hypothetical protein